MDSAITKMYKESGKRLTQIRTLMGKSLKEFATDLQITVTELKGIEAGRRKNIYLSLSHIYEAYGINFAWLSTGKQNVFETHGSKVPTEIYNLVNMLPFMDEKYKNISWLIYAMENPSQKELLLTTGQNVVKSIELMTEQGKFYTDDTE